MIIVVMFVSGRDARAPRREYLLKKQTLGGLVKPSRVVIGLSEPEPEYYFFIFLRATIAAPSNPVPNSTKVPGSGTSGAPPMAVMFIS